MIQQDLVQYPCEGIVFEKSNDIYRIDDKKRRNINT